MPNEIRLLVIEDNAGDRDSWERAVERHNAASEGDEAAVFLKLHTAVSAEHAMELLDSTDMDAAVIDIQLAGTEDPDNSDGNAVLERILARELAVAAIFTGQPTDARVPDYAKNQVEIFTKGADETEGTRTVMAWVVSQYPLIGCMRAATLTIRKEMASAFNHSIWPRWRFWMEDPLSGEKSFLDDSVARHIIAHVYETLSDRSGGRAHAEEWYLLPPNPAGIRTGDLIKNSAGGVEIVVTPRCDFATGKNQTIQLVSCEDVSGEWNKTAQKLKELQATVAKLKAEKTEIGKEIADELGKQKVKLTALTLHNGNKQAVHFLPKMKLAAGESVGPLLVHFDQIRSLSKNDKDPSLTEASRRFATLAPVFLPSLVERLGSFFSRIGTPNYFHIDEGNSASTSDTPPSDVAAA